jgi:hypothetical protein
MVGWQRIRGGFFLGTFSADDPLTFRKGSIVQTKTKGE